jgi:NB-ARC domain-containing protein
MNIKIKILLLATNPMDVAYVPLGDHLREIDSKIRVGPYGDSFETITKPAVRMSDLGTYLLKHKPHIVHITGQGTDANAIILEDDAGKARPVTVDELVTIIRTFNDNLRLIVLNACYTKDHAEALSKIVDYAIGIDGEIHTDPLRTFAGCFYQTLAFGLSVNEAFDAAKAVAGSALPILFVRKGVDPLEPFVQAAEARKLKATLSRLIDGTASDDERLTLQREVAGGAIILDENETQDSADGEAKPFTVYSRDKQLHVHLTAAAYQEMRERLFPPRPGIPPPFPPFVFIGRDGALRDVKQLVSNKTLPGKEKIAVVRGWPGVGKTTLVGVIGRDAEIATTFPQGVLWTSLEQKPNVLSEMARWGRALGTDEILRAPTLPEATAQLAALLRRRQMLLIVDDVWETAHAVPFMEVVGDQCALLITTRLTSVAEELTTDEKGLYVLPVLTEDDSLKLLRVLAPEIVQQHEDDCRQLVSDLECLPLALHVAGRLLRSEAKHGWGVADLIREIREGAKLLPERAPNDRLEGKDIPTVSALLMKSTNVLDEFTRDCFAYLGAFAPKPATFDLEAMQAVWEVDDAKPIVRKLVGHGLLEPAASGRFQMHRILVDHARSLCSE